LILARVKLSRGLFPATLTKSQDIFLRDRTVFLVQF
jgi:hypothetical protein